MRLPWGDRPSDADIGAGPTGGDLLSYNQVRFLEQAVSACTMAREAEGDSAIPSCAAHKKMLTLYWDAQVTILESRLEEELAWTLDKENLATLTAEESFNRLNSQHEAAKLASVTSNNLLAAEVAKGRLAAAKAANELATVIADGMMEAEKAANALEAEAAINPVTPMMPTADVASDMAEIKNTFVDIMSAVRAFCAANDEVSLCKAVSYTLY